MSVVIDDRQDERTLRGKLGMAVHDVRPAAIGQDDNPPVGEAHH